MIPFYITSRGFDAIAIAIAIAIADVCFCLARA